MSFDTTNSLFEKAVAFVNHTDRHLFITGKAGTGKTTFLKYIKENSSKKMAIVAPTGVAAINAGGVTIHSFLQLPLGSFLPIETPYWNGYNGEVNNRTSLLKNLRLRAEKKRVIEELELLIIDEISMVRADVLDMIDTVLRSVRPNAVPFGGVQLVYIGDLYQLPPVVKSDEWQQLKQYYNSPFFFDAQVFQQIEPVLIELKKIYRQKDDLFITILNNIRNNCCTPADLGVLNERYDPGFVPPKAENYIVLTSHNNKADEINRTRLNQLPGKLYGFEATIRGEFADRSFPADQVLQVKVGAQVMFLKNDKGEERRFYNGKIGVVKKIVDEVITISFPNETETLDIEPEKWNNVKYNYDAENDEITEEEIGSFSQYPLKLAWAITIHKSQGLTFEKAIIDAGASFAPGQVYVSLSRLTSIEGLVLYSKILPGSISTDPRIIEFSGLELPEHKLQQVLENEQKRYATVLLSKNFDFTTLYHSFTVFLQQYDRRAIAEKEKAIAWATLMFEQIRELLQVSRKFQKQLDQMLADCNDNYKQLHERTQAATTYFTGALQNNIFNSLDQHIKTARSQKKSKQYVKSLNQLRALVVQKKLQLEQALGLSAALHGSAPLIAPKIPSVHQQNPTSISTEKTKLQKGESKFISLQLYNSGKSISEIAASRGLTSSTIESHLIQVIKSGDLHVTSVVDQTTIDRVLSFARQNTGSTLNSLKEQLPDLSFFTIRAVLSAFGLNRAKPEANEAALNT